MIPGNRADSLSQPPNPLYGQLELGALEHLVVVDPEEVAVKNRLDDTRDNRDIVNVPLGLRRVPVDPVGDVQRAVHAQREQVVRRDGLGLAGALQHEELREDGDGLEPDGEGPEDLGGAVRVGEEDGEHGGAGEEVLHAECVRVGVLRRPVRVRHQVDDVALGADEEDLEDEVVGRLGPEDVCSEGLAGGMAGGWARSSYRGISRGRRPCRGLAT